MIWRLHEAVTQFQLYFKGTPWFIVLYQIQWIKQLFKNPQHQCVGKSRSDTRIVILTWIHRVIFILELDKKVDPVKHRQKRSGRFGETGTPFGTRGSRSLMRTPESGCHPNRNRLQLPRADQHTSASPRAAGRSWDPALPLRRSCSKTRLALLSIN